MKIFSCNTVLGFFRRIFELLILTHVYLGIFYLTCDIHRVHQFVFIELLAPLFDSYRKVEQEAYSKDIGHNFDPPLIPPLDESGWEAGGSALSKINRGCSTLSVVDISHDGSIILCSTKVIDQYTCLNIMNSVQQQF